MQKSKVTLDLLVNSMEIFIAERFLCPFSIRNNESHILAHENSSVILPGFVWDFLANVLCW